MNEEIMNERQSSINISRTSKGVYSWDAKIYYDADKTSSEDIIMKLVKIDDDLKNKFGGKE